MREALLDGPGELYYVRATGVAVHAFTPATERKEGKGIMTIQSATASSHPTLSYGDALAASTADALLLIARILMGWIFVRSGFGKLMDIGAFAATMPGKPASMTNLTDPTRLSERGWADPPGWMLLTKSARRSCC